MPLTLILAGIALSGVSGLIALFLPRRGSAGQLIGTFVFAAGCAAALVGAFWELAFPVSHIADFPWPAFGGGAVSLDALSAFFLVPVFVVGGLGAVYALGYYPQSENPLTFRSVQFFYGTMTAGMGLVVIARHALVLLLGWEFMALSAFFLITADNKNFESRRAGLVYLIATHASTLALVCLSAVWKSATGSFELAPTASLGPGVAIPVFILALVGFGLKAGILPLHFWLPGAHAASPSHVSAYMSGVLIKMGIYGLLRIISLFPDIPLSWGAIVLVLGLVSALLGVAFALAQHDIKRLLAYHSVENIGIILMGLGLAMTGRSLDNPVLVSLGLGACLLHTWNHSLFKSLLFMGAGSIQHATGTRRIDRLGGLAKTMPLSALLFIVGAVAICGLPPLNGFVSELVLYIGLFGQALADGTVSALSALAAVGLAMVGALALACFVKATGVVFLGEPRSDAAAKAHESPASMIVSMIVLALACVCIAFAPQAFAPALDAATFSWSGAGDIVSHNVSTLTPSDIGTNTPSITEHAPLTLVGALSAGLTAAVLLLGVCVMRPRRIRRTAQASASEAGSEVGTWDCGYARPTSRMQYTASSFARGIVGMFSWAVRPPAEGGRIEGAFPKGRHIHLEAGDPVLDRCLVPAFRRITGLAFWLRRFQQGLTQQYVLYILIVLVLLLGTLFLPGLSSAVSSGNGAVP